MRALNIYAVRDTKANTYIGPLVHDYSPVPIIRQITEAVNKPGNLISNNPEDFEIWHIGHLNEEDGTVHTITPIERIATALALKAATQ